MTTLLRFQQRAGRFGRELRGDDVETRDDRENRVTPDYVVDPDAVAAAIVERLIAGRTLVLEPAPRRRG